MRPVAVSSILTEAVWLQWALLLMLMLLLVPSRRRLYSVCVSFVQVASTDAYEANEQIEVRVDL